jgi:hypothetical protein
MPRPQFPPHCISPQLFDIGMASELLSLTAKHDLTSSSTLFLFIAVISTSFVLTSSLGSILSVAESSLRHRVGETAFLRQVLSRSFQTFSEIATWWESSAMKIVHDLIIDKRLEASMTRRPRHQIVRIRGDAQSRSKVESRFLVFVEGLLEQWTIDQRMLSNLPSSCIFLCLKL